MMRPLAVAVHHGFVALALVLLSASGSLRAQEARDQLIRSAETAYEEFETGRALDLLQAAIDPTVGPADSLWAHGVHLLAQIYIEEGEEQLATPWLRWAARLSPDMVVGRALFLPEVLAASEAARRFAGRPGPGDAVTVTSWEWSRGRPEAEGRVRIQPSPLPVPVQVLVQGRVVRPGQSVTLPPGSYDIQAAGEGYRSARVTRELLPGITTVLSFNLTPVAVAVADTVLPDAVESASIGKLARLSVQRFGTEAACASGFVVGADGVVLTTYQAIRGAESVEVAFSDGTRIRSGIAIAAHDVANDVAVVKLPARRADSLVLAREVVPGQYAWALGFPDCGEATATRLRIGPGGEGPGGLQLIDAPAGAELGGPVINQAGAVVGIGTGSMTAVPASRARTVLASAGRNIAARQLRTLGEVARQENHIYGSVAISATLAGATAQITPLESWHWPDLAHTALLPLTYAGPMGRYQLEMTLAGQVRHRSEFLIRPGSLERLTVSPDVLPEPQIAVQPSGGGGFPWPIALLGIAGAGAAVAVLAGGGGGDGPINGPTNGPTTGSITFFFPNP